MVRPVWAIFSYAKLRLPGHEVYDTLCLGYKESVGPSPHSNAFGLILHMQVRRFLPVQVQEMTLVND